MGYRGFLAGVGSNVARSMVNFHNSLDYALATGHKFLGLKETNWEKNEEDYKPDGNYPLYGWEYHYLPTEALARRAYLINHGFNFVPPIFPGVPGAEQCRAVTDSYEMKSFVARPRSRAVGAGEGTAANPLASGPIRANVNMRTTFGFGREDYDHSGQFNRRIQQVYDLYGRVFDIVK